MKTLQELIDRQKRSKIDNVKLNNTMYSLTSREHYEKQLQELKGRFQGKDEAIIFWYEIVNNDSDNKACRCHVNAYEHGVDLRDDILQDSRWYGVRRLIHAD